MIVDTEGLSDRDLRLLAHNYAALSQDSSTVPRLRAWCHSLTLALIEEIETRTEVWQQLVDGFDDHGNVGELVDPATYDPAAEFREALRREAEADPDASPDDPQPPSSGRIQ